MPRFPDTSATAEGLSDRVFSGLVARARARGQPVAPLHVGDTYLEPPPALRAEMQWVSARPGLHRYAPVQGVPALLDAVVARLRDRGGRAVPVEQVQVTAGGTGGLSAVATTLLDPGDEVVLLAPFWPLARGIVRSRGAVVREVPFFDRLGSAGFDPEAALEAVVGPRTVAIYVCSPNNPTGTVLDDDTLGAIGHVAARHDLWVLADEAYEDLRFDVPAGGGADVATPTWAHPRLRDRSVAIHTLSKGFAAAGVRLGWVHGPARLMEALRGVHTFHAYCAPHSMQYGAAVVLRQCAEWQAHVRALYAEAARAAADAVGVPTPAGGTFVFFDASPYLPADATSSAPLLERAVDAGVLLTPGSACGQAYGRWVRLCFTAVPPAELHGALAALRGVLDEARVKPSEPTAGSSHPG
jgi:N-succinyldiaminopimelate aminotransferase